MKLTAGDKVAHKGQKWEVVGDLGGLVRITRDGEVRVVRYNQVRPL